MEINFNREKVLRIGKVKDKTLLDIGSGPLAGIAAGDFNCKVTSIDISESALNQARGEISEKLRGKISFEKEDATCLSYADNSFDIVISYAALHHININKRNDFIEEAFRVAREKVIIVEFNPAYFNKVHSKDPYKLVDFTWLEKKLSTMGKLKKYHGIERSIFILNKN